MLKVFSVHSTRAPECLDIFWITTIEQELVFDDIGTYRHDIIHETLTTKRNKLALF